MAGQFMTIRLNRQDAQPWGFRLQGGKDFGTALVVQKVNGGSLADQAGLMPGDAVLKINNFEVFNLRHKDAQDIVVRSGNNFDVTVQRGGSTWRPQVIPTGNMPHHSPHLGSNIHTVTKTSLAHKQQDVRPIGTGYNNAARPFSNVNGGDGQVKSIVNKQYNTPVGIYSEEAIAETLSAQAEVLAGGVLGVNFKKNEKIYNGANSEVLKMLHEQETDPAEPEPHAPANFFWTASHAIGGRRSPGPRTRSHSRHAEDERIGTQIQVNTLEPHRSTVLNQENHQKPQQQQQQQHEDYKQQIHHQQSQQQSHQQVSKQTSAEQSYSKIAQSTRSSTACQSTGTGGTVSSHTGGTACNACGASIVGVFVRIKDKNLHNECFKCATCGTSLKNQGYFNLNNKLYCDIHARLAALNNPPPGTEGYSPVPIKPCARISANTISAALNAYCGPQTNGTSHHQSHASNVNTGYGGPKPFNSGPMSPPVGGPRSPASYPPPSQAPSWAQPKQAPKPAMNPYATLPRATGQSKGRFTKNMPGFNTFNKAKKLIMSGLHKPDNIPQYQRNWTVLPSQRPVKTPEPPELRENVPLAFIDIPREPSPNRQNQNDIVQSVSSSVSHAAGSAVSNVTKDSESTSKQSTTPRTTVPIIVEERAGPITMTFQSIDETQQQQHQQTYQLQQQSQQLHDNHSHSYARPLTPSLINKPAPIIPFYQQPDKLVIEECAPRSSQPFDRRSASPCPDRAHSPAPGPPPNPLSAIRAPRIRDDEIYGLRPQQTGSITTGQSYLGTQMMQQQQKQQQQGQVLSHYQTASQSGAQSFIDKPEVVTQKQIGDMNIQTRAKESHLSEEKRAELQSQTTTQVGNTQIERRRKVIEEFEHTQSAKTIEIRKTGSGAATTSSPTSANRQYGKTGFVANQARRLSGLEQEISSITSQSQAISARARDMTFPQLKSPEPVSSFPIKNAFPPHDEPQRTSYVISTKPTDKLVGPPPGFPSQLSEQWKRQQQNEGHQQSQTKDISSSSNYATSSITQSSQNVLDNQTNASATKQTSCASNSLTTAIPVPAFKPPMPSVSSTCASSSFIQGGGSDLSNKTLSQQQQLINNNNNTYKPTPSTGPAGFKPPPPPPSNINPSVVVSDPSPASAGPNKGGAFGATSAPKRGRGILNKAVGPGVRVPLCGCCSSQIRGPFITALGRIWCPDHFVCINGNCRRALQDIGFVEEKGDLYCEYCFEKYLAPSCNKCNSKIKGDCLNAIGKHFHPECFTCSYCGKLFGNSPFFLEEGEPYCEADWNELFTTKCFACGFPVEAGDRWVEALNHNYHSQCFNCTMCKKNLEGQSFYNKGGRPFCKNHAR